MGSVQWRGGWGWGTDFPFGAAINRQYAINLTAAGPYQATLRLHYQDPELNGNDESTMALWQNAGAWAASRKSANDATGNWVEQSGVPNLVGRWTASAS